MCSGGALIHFAWQSATGSIQLIGLLYEEALKVSENVSANTCEDHLGPGLDALLCSI